MSPRHPHRAARTVVFGLWLAAAAMLPVRADAGHGAPAALHQTTLAHTAAQAAADLRPELELGGSAWAAASDGNTVFVAVHSRLVVLDGRFPGAPPIAQTAPLGPRITALAARDGLVLAAGRELTIFDAANPRQLAPLAQLRLPREATAIAWVGDEAWLWGGESTVMRVDVSDTARPRLGSLWRPPAPHGPDELGGDAAGEIHAVAPLGPDSVAVLTTVPGERSWLFVVDARPGAAPEIRHAHRLPCCQTMLTAGDGLLILGKGTGSLLRATFEPDGSLKLAAIGAPVFPADDRRNVVALHLDRHGLWAVADRYFVALIDPNAGATGGAIMSLPSGGETRGSAVVPYGVFVLGATTSGWVDPEGRTRRDTLVGTMPAAEVEAAPGGAWVLGASGAVFRARQDPQRGWRLDGVGIGMGTSRSADGMRARRGWLHLRGNGLRDIDGRTPGAAPIDVAHELPEPLTGANVLGLHAANERGLLVELSLSDGAAGLDYATYLRRFDGDRELPPTHRTYRGSDRPPDVQTLDGDLVWTVRALGRGIIQLRAYEDNGEGRLLAIGPGLAVTAVPTLLVAREGWLLLDSGNDLLVVDGRDPAHPRAVGMIDLPGAPTAAAFDGWRLWVGSAGQDGRGALSLLDLRDPTWPVEIATANPGAPPRDIAVADDRVWVTADAVQVYRWSAVPGDGSGGGEPPDPGGEGPEDARALYLPQLTVP